MKSKYLLAIICLFFLFTRFYKISEIPPSVYWDEASIGYNAYSIVQTGKDEWGKSLPIHFRAFGEFKLPVYIYATAVSIKLFGLNEFSVRFPAVMFSLGVVILTYFLAKKFSGDTTVGLFSSFFVTISPWFFIFSRTGYEAVAGLMFYLLALFFFLEYNKNKWFIPLSVSSFILSAYSYNSFRVIAPLTIFILILCNLKNFKNNLSKSILPLMLSIILFVLSIIPIYRLYVYDAGGVRLQTVSSRKASFIKNYLLHFSPDFLVLQGDKNLRSQQAGFGQLYFSDFILLLLGFVYIAVSKSKYRFLPIAFILIAPIPAALTKESPHALRSISAIPAICMISAEGVVYLKRFISKKYFIELLVVAISLIFFTNYLIKFLTVYPIQSSQDWQYAYKKIFTDFKDDFSKYDHVIISDEYAQPYIFALFYLRYDPNKFRENVARNSVDNWGFSTVARFDKFEFGKVKKLLEKNSGNTLVFASQNENIPNLNLIGQVKFLDGKTAIWMYKLD